ncbi:hypothetical protein LLH00_09590 [bacterium]|nr:hypothetical protein [bacterium]
MPSFQECMSEYRLQLGKGAIQKAYKGLMEYMQALKTHLKDRYPEYYVSGGLYFGYMDMTYFAFSPEALKQRNLKIAIVFNHEEFRFEAWLSGYNKPVQTQYWQLFKDSGWDRHRVVPTVKGYDSIVEHVLVEAPDFRDLNSLTGRIEQGILKFIHDIEIFLSEH